MSRTSSVLVAVYPIAWSIVSVDRLDILEAVAEIGNTSCWIESAFCQRNVVMILVITIFVFMSVIMFMLIPMVMITSIFLVFAC